MLACASDLTDEFKDELRGVRRALEMQGICNAAVDEAVAAEVCGDGP